MKYWLGLMVALLIFFVFTRSPQSIPPISTSPSPINSPAPSSFVVSAHNQKYSAYLQEIDNPKSLVLIPNFSEKKVSKTIMQENKCRFGTNGGFYTKSSQPLGLFYIQGHYLNETIHNQSFFNGFVTRTKNRVLDITTETPSNNSNADFFFQSGPLISPQSHLSIKDDEPARRVLLTKTEAGGFYFLALTESENTNSGPYLEEVPQLLLQLPIQIATAINLDGGSASTFYQENGITLSELVAVGSFLCLQY